jgi:hypothetical protein
LPTNTYTALGTITLGSSASAVTFSNIPATYRDLVFSIQGTSSGADGQIRPYLNGDTAANYYGLYVLGDGSATDTNSNAVSMYPKTTLSSWVMQIMDYSATDKHKTILTRQSTPAQYTLAAAVRWANTAAVQTVAFDFIGAETWSSGTTFNLWGIAA